MTRPCERASAHVRGILCRPCGYGRGLPVDLDRAPTIPRAAVVVATMTIPNGHPEYAGECQRITLYEGSASHGYKTGYQHVPERWTEAVRSWQNPTDWRRRDVYRYSGRRYAVALSDWRALEAEIAARGAA